MQLEQKRKFDDKKYVDFLYEFDYHQVVTEMVVSILVHTGMDIDNDWHHMRLQKRRKRAKVSNFI